MKCALLRSPIDGRLVLEVARERPSISASEPCEGKTLGRTYEMLYPLTRICPVYLSSIGREPSSSVSYSEECLEDALLDELER